MGPEVAMKGKRTRRKNIVMTANHKLEVKDIVGKMRR